MSDDEPKASQPTLDELAWQLLRDLCASLGVSAPCSLAGENPSEVETILAALHTATADVNSKLADVSLQAIGLIAEKQRLISTTAQQIDEARRLVDGIKREANYYFEENGKVINALGLKPDDIIPVSPAGALIEKLNEANNEILAAKDAFTRVRGIAGASDKDPMPAEHYVQLLRNQLAESQRREAAMRGVLEEIKAHDHLGSCSCVCGLMLEKVLVENTGHNFIPRAKADALADALERRKLVLVSITLPEWEAEVEKALNDYRGKE